MFSAVSKQYKDIAPAVVNSRHDLLRVDVRQPNELKSELGVMEDVRNVPLGDVLRSGLPGVAKDTPVLVICRSGGRSGRAAAALATMGYQHVYNMAGGMMAWNAARLPRA